MHRRASAQEGVCVCVHCLFVCAFVRVRKRREKVGDGERREMRDGVSFFKYSEVLVSCQRSYMGLNAVQMVGLVGVTLSGNCSVGRSTVSYPGFHSLFVLPNTAMGFLEALLANLRSLMGTRTSCSRQF